MKRLDGLTLRSTVAQHTIDLYEGDLADMPTDAAVDVLVVSAYPNNYGRMPHTLIGSLAAKGVSVAALATDKFVDLRAAFDCWLSKPILDPPAGIAFKRVLCFEPAHQEDPAEVVGGIFQSLMPFVYGEPFIKSVAMPLVIGRRRYVTPAAVLEPLLERAVSWLKLGLPVTSIKIVERDPARAAELKGAFGVLKKQYVSSLKLEPEAQIRYRYDFFLSYSRQNAEAANALYDAMMHLDPKVKIFLDRKQLTTGAAWQQQLYEALDDCCEVIAMISPAYLESKVCKEEFNIAMLRHRDSSEGILRPLYLHSAALPSYMQLVQFIDCREGDLERLQAAAQQLLQR